MDGDLPARAKDCQAPKRSTICVGNGLRHNAQASILIVRLINVLGDGPVDAFCVILEMLLVLQPHSTDLTLEPIPFFYVGQMLPLKMLC